MDEDCAPLVLGLRGGGDFGDFPLGEVKRETAADAALLGALTVNLAEVCAVLTERAELGFLGMIDVAKSAF